MLKKGYYTEFLDEIRPLAHFAQQQYPETYQIEPILGNQGYDVIVYDDFGKECERLELTRPHDGAAVATDAALVVERGYGEVSISQPGNEFERLVPVVASTCKNKALKDYNDCTLVIYISPEPPFRGFESRFADTLNRLITLLTSITFKAKRVVLFLHPD